ncbi:MAG TPA: SpoIIE family protein phosphatase [Solirubrobacteraceae bacterium]|jgi:serine phosphatase RsbU (regulator of sigma subunit)|nr:SpoIIE family protein phosphatase [Solirubrobacteraceae bacterium]
MAGSPPRVPGAPSEALRERYAAAFRAWLAHRDERELGTAYALGREAVHAQLSVLDLAQAHHEAAAEALRAEPDPARAAELIAAASTFLGEALSTFEIAHRGYHEVQEVARLEHEHVEQLRALAAASVRINATLTTEEALQLSADAAQEVLGARRARIASATGDPFARSLSATAPAGGTSEETGRPIGVMLRSAGRPLGTLEVADDPAREFSPRDEAILAHLGQVASVAIAKTEAYTRERHIAQVLQRSLLPAALPTVPGLAAAVRFIAAGEGIEVGGDFYDLFGIADDGVAALIGDVCGKGPEAASVTALARHTLRAAAVYERRPSAVLALLHRALRDARNDGRFCTVAYGELHPSEDGARMVLACGGHPLPLVLRASGAVEPVGKLGTLLGADVEPVLADVELRLAAGDLLVLYTDGVTEVRAGRCEVFGHDDLAALLAGCRGLPADTVAERVQDAVLDAAGGRPRDDIAILVIGPQPRPAAGDPGTIARADRPRRHADG